MIAVTGLALLDFLLGTVRAFAGKGDGVLGTNFRFESFSTWVRSQLLGHVVPIVLTFTFSQVIGSVRVGDLSLNIMFAAATAGSLAFATTTLASIADSVNPRAADPVPPPAT
jgi:hypothetical protein